jgi:hypothetical protein
MTDIRELNAELTILDDACLLILQVADFAIPRH